MTINDRIHAQSFCYDADLPPSVPEGQPLRSSRAADASRAPKQRLRRGLRSLSPRSRRTSR